MDNQIQPSGVNPEENKVSLAFIDEPIIKVMAKYIDEDVLNNIELTKKEIVELVKYVIKSRYGEYNNIPMTCTGVRCVHKNTCPLVKFNKPPIGKECPLERYNLEEWRKDYAESLNADMNDKNEREQIMDMVEADILDARANAVLATEGFIMYNTVAYDYDSGQEITRKEEHIALKLKDRVKLRKDKKLKDFIGTRKDKMQTLTAIKEDPTQYFARLREAAKETMDRHKVLDVDVSEEKPKETKPEEQKQPEETSEPF